MTGRYCGKVIPYGHDQTGVCGNVYYGAVLQCNSCAYGGFKKGQRVRYIGTLYKNKPMPIEGVVVFYNMISRHVIVEWDMVPGLEATEVEKDLELVK